jgi:hypothetical protein
MKHGCAAMHSVLQNDSNPNLLSLVSGVYCFNKKPFVIGHLVKTDVFINFSDSPIFANKTEYYKKNRK